MNILDMKYMGTGWLLTIEFPEKTRDKVNITQDVFYPNVPTTRVELERVGHHIDHPKEVIRDINCNFPEYTQKSFGSITIKGFVKFIPQYEVMYQKNSRYYARHTGQEYSIISPLASQLPDLRKGTIPMGFKTVLEKIYNLEYVLVNHNWIPAPVWKIMNQIKKEQKRSEENARFYTEFMQADNYENQMRVLHKHTVPLDAVIQKTDKIPHEYVVVEMPVANGAVSNYGAVRNNKPAPPNFKLPEGETPWKVYEIMQKAGIY